MRRNFTLLIPFIVIGVFILTAFGNGDANHDYPSGAPAGYTGSPGDGHNCTSCHNGSASTLSGIITSDVPAQGYTPGSDYTITVTLTGSGNKGFEVSPQNTAGDLVGTLTSGSGNKLVGSGKYCTHSSAVGGSSATWHFTWTAPAAGTGDVTFYGAFCITKPVTKLSTLVVPENTASPLSANATATPSSICLGGTSQLNVSATGGSGTYTYSWTSNPAGFTSTLQNPVVTPVQTTQYIADVNDGTGSTTASTQVFVTDPPTSFAGNDTTCCISVNEIPLSGLATGYSGIAWTTGGDGTFSNASSLNSLYYPGSADKSNGSVSLTLTASPEAPCSDPASGSRVIMFDTCAVGIPTYSLVSFSVFPNPSNGIITIRCTCQTLENIRVSLNDLTGKILLSESIHAEGYEVIKMLDLSFLTKGIYFVSVKTISGTRTEKLILQ